MASKPPRNLTRKPRPKSPGQRWRARRDLVISLVANRGATQRLLADVFDLPVSRINAILKESRAGQGV